MEPNYEENAKVFKALCDASRLKILDMLKQGEHCACHLLEELTIGQPTLSHHMKILCESGIVTCRKEGKWMHYSINTQGCRYAIQLLEELAASCSSQGHDHTKTVESLKTDF